MSPTEQIDQSTTLAEERPTRNSSHGVLKRLYHGETRADIVGRWKLWFLLSGALILVGIAGLVGRGLNLGIDFTGGTVWELRAGDAEIVDITKAMTDLGYRDVQAQEITQNSGGTPTRFIRVEAESTAEPADETTKALNALRADVTKARGAAPSGEKGSLSTVLDSLDGIDGPFEIAVPEPLVAVQAEVDGLSAALEGATDDAAKSVVYSDATERMLTSVDQLEDLESAERTRLGQDVTAELARLTGTPEAEVTVDTVGPSWGQQISEKARNALVVFMIAIMIFISIRFEWKMALATIVALIHDLLLVVGLYALFGFPVTPATVIALLTMLGFSIYDGIVVFDRVDENTHYVTGNKPRMTYSEMANLSLNQVLMRSLNTSITTLLPIASVLVIGAFILGASTLEEYGLALFLGLLSGAYSSLFIATPLLAVLKEREPQFRAVRENLAKGRNARVANSASALVDTGDNPLAPGSAPPTPEAGGALSRESVADLGPHIRDIPDFPSPGVVFKDITPLLANGPALRSCIEAMREPFAHDQIDKVIGVEARGFILASPVAADLGVGFVPVRKPGKLPWTVEGEEYSLEYGTDRLEVHSDAIVPGERVLIVDDVLATGGTAAAAARLVERLGGELVGFSFLIELGFLNGRSMIAGERISSVLTY